MKKIVSVLLALVLALGLCSAFAENSALPAYTYPGDDPIWTALVKYMQETDFGYEVPEGGVLIPTPVIIEQWVNDEETESIFWGNFWIFTYTLEGKILKTGPCGENPGIITLEKKNGEWTVVSAEFAEDGTYNESIKRFANGDKDLEAKYYMTTGSNPEESFLPQFQHAAVVEYVAANSLDIEAYQDPGQDPVSVID